MTPRSIQDFEGRWHLSRRITSVHQPAATFQGQAAWQRAEGGCWYTETGQMQIGSSAPMQAERRYFWRSDLSVWFEDGKFFHDVPPLGGAVRHWCDPDEYLGHYVFSAWPAFEVSWQVTGPRKAYAMISRYTRSPEKGLR